jgi:octaprenyl-diphosphate synthase
MGDYLLARGLQLSLENGDHDFLEATSRAVKRMSEGELLQIQKTRQLDLDEETYFRIIADKTASLLSTCMEIGAASASAEAGLRRQMRDFGESVGIAFQIRDDLLDYLGRKNLLGKPTGLDVKEKKLTLPLIYAMKQAQRKDARKALSIVKDGGASKKLPWLMDFVDREGGIRYATETAERFADEAKEKLRGLPDSPSRAALHQFVDFVIARDR